MKQTRCETQNLEENIKDPAYSKSCRPKRTGTYPELMLVKV